MRTVIYARFSSQLQNSRSIDDQIAVCRERADREGWPVLEIFTDYAISGAAGISEAQRPGLAALLSRVEAGGVDQVLTEATDRIARHQGDSFAIRERLSFAGARLFTLSDGEVTDISGTFKGLMDAQFRKELGAKIKRGQRGTVAADRSPAGLAYGYRTANRIDENGRPLRGLREIQPDEADIVRRIFREFNAGMSARTIAAALNAEGVLGPRGSHWRATTINGDGKRGNGILRNELYIGRLVHNRTSKVVEPTTRTTRIRVNPESAWVTEDVPHLRIIDQEAWEAARERHARSESLPLHRRVRSRRMLSGLGVCGLCGESWIVIGSERWGCTKHKSDGSCTNNRQITTDQFERRVLAGLRERMLDPELVALFVREYHQEYARRSADTKRESTKLEKRVTDAAAKVQRLVAAIATGAGEFAEIREALTKAKADRDAATAELAEVESLPVVALHPTIAADYRRRVDKLNEELADPEARQEALPALRGLIDRLVIHPHPTARGVEIEIEGRLAAMLSLAGFVPQPEQVSASGDGRLYVLERVKGIEPSS
ncbi:recombinase family protein [Sphingomonas radiodurans]|uniref:recombinase family protein n=1 Tax=Sphingomonas radiodurans TaxID=2890321 RepID=UPI001E328DDB|nr:recombinase family protein [Sphingomonas radiodurans]WBH17052.1 recombinase family protein [Sphingomonas radiodurans]